MIIAIEVLKTEQGTWKSCTHKLLEVKFGGRTKYPRTWTARVGNRDVVCTVTDHVGSQQHLGPGKTESLLVPVTAALAQALADDAAIDLLPAPHAANCRAFRSRIGEYDASLLGDRYVAK